jgi:hypothetical protein
MAVCRTDVTVSNDISSNKDQPLFIAALDLYSIIGEVELLGSAIALSAQVRSLHASEGKLTIPAILAKSHLRPLARSSHDRYRLEYETFP